MILNLSLVASVFDLEEHLKCSGQLALLETLRDTCENIGKEDLNEIEKRVSLIAKRSDFRKKLGISYVIDADSIRQYNLQRGPVSHPSHDAPEVQSHIKAPPGWQLRKHSEFLFSRKVFKLVIEPTLHDLYEEYCEALSKGHPWKAGWVRVRGYWSFWSAVVAQLPISLMRKVYELWKSSS